MLYLNSIRRLLFHHAHTRVELLLSFIKLLEEKKLLDFSKFDVDMGLRIQKYVYLSRRYGLNWDYNFDMYAYGPYSSDLGEDCYDLHEAPKSTTGSMPDSFMENEFMELVGGKTDKWLEIAALLLNLEKKFDDSEELVNHVESIELGVTVDYIRSVLHDLVKLRVLA